MHRIESKDHRIGTYEINSLCLALEKKNYILNNLYDALAVGN